MPTPAENIDTAIANVARQLAEMTDSPKPSYSVGGLSVSWGEHFSSLTSQLKTLQELRQQLAGPFEVVTKARG